MLSKLPLISKYEGKKLTGLSFFKFSPEDMLRERKGDREGERGRERGTDRSVAFHTCPNLDLNRQPFGAQDY